jgi:hypothetical protein
MTNEEFLRDVCPNHTDKSQWNKSELLHILKLYKEQLRLHNVVNRRELLVDFAMKRNNAPDFVRGQYENDADKYLSKIN